MNLDLRRGDSCFSVSMFTWVRAYDLAIEGGWEPQGTLPPANYFDEEEWPGVYDCNDGQIIEAEDAYEMADALEDMLSELKERPSESQTEIDQQEDPFALKGSRISAPDYFSIESKRKILKSLIGFLRGGACEIW